MILCIEKVSKKPIGIVSAIINANSTGWVSMFIVDEQHRRKGLGRHLFSAALADFASKGVQIVGLDAVVEQRQTCMELPLQKLRHKAADILRCAL